MGYEQFLGLDLSLMHTGWCVVEAHKAPYNGVLEPTPYGNELERIIWTTSRIKQLVLTHKPKDIGIEDYAFSKGQFAHAKGELGGLVRLLLHKMGYDPFIIKPNVAKKFATGKGSSEKSLIIKEVYKRYDIDFDDDNICDAFVIAKMTQARYDQQYSTKAQTELAQASKRLSEMMYGESRKPKGKKNGSSN